MNDLVRTYWQAYLDSHSECQFNQPDLLIDHFGDSPELADRLVALILTGEKTATCSALAEYEATGEAIPEVGQLAIVVNSSGEPQCVREITEVQVSRFCEVDDSFAYDEGEDDRTLASWRRGHKRFFSRLMPQLGLEFSEEMLLVCERFRVINRAQASN